MSNLVELIKSRFVYMLAPMEEVADNAFRALCFFHGADVTFTEMTRTEGLCRRNAATWSRFKVHDSTPTIFQILVGKHDSLRKSLELFKPEEGFEGFDINVGCPSPNVINHGHGCAMMKRVSAVRRHVNIIRDYGYPVSIKMRLGLNSFEKSKKVYMNLIEGADPDFFIVHARHGAQMYVEPADFSVYRECVDSGKIIIANGDITSIEQVRRLQSQGVRGVMIGRAAVANPAIFDRLKGKSSATINDLKKEYLELAKKFGTQKSYQENVLKRLGSDLSADRDSLV